LVDSLPPCAPLRQQIGVLENAEMLGDGREGDVEGFGKLARRFFAVSQRDENRPPRRVGNRMEHVILL
jgi:hypothetical protein